ncbi:O-acyltransferase [Aureococcus anophagefferens]|nr:O-acyltransferase [Aureococcus anophagefferens]
MAGVDAADASPPSPPSNSSDDEGFGVHHDPVHQSPPRASPPPRPKNTPPPPLPGLRGASPPSPPLTPPPPPTTPSSPLRRSASAPGVMMESVRRELAAEHERRVRAEEESRLIRYLSPFERFLLFCYARVARLAHIPRPRFLVCGGPLFWCLVVPGLWFRWAYGVSPLALVAPGETPRGPLVRRRAAARDGRAAAAGPPTRKLPVLMLRAWRAPARPPPGAARATAARPARAARGRDGAPAAQVHGARGLAGRGLLRGQPRRRLWSSPSMLSQFVLRPACLQRHLALNGTTWDDPADIKVRASSGLGAADAFGPLNLWGELMANLAILGYDEASLRLLGFDWRLSAQRLEARDGFFTQVKAEVELLGALSGAKVALFESHGGIQRRAVADLTRSWASVPALLPKGGDAFWRTDDFVVLDEPPADVRAALERDAAANGTVAAALLAALAKNRTITAPSLEIYCLYGTGRSTPKTFEFAWTRPPRAPAFDDAAAPRPAPPCFRRAASPRQVPERYLVISDAGAPGSGVIAGDGDGTVPILSLGYLCASGYGTKARNPARVRVRTKEYAHEHTTTYDALRSPLDTISGLANDKDSDHITSAAPLLGNREMTYDVIDVVAYGGAHFEERVESDICDLAAELRAELPEERVLDDGALTACRDRGHAPRPSSTFQRVIDGRKRRMDLGPTPPGQPPEL